jgi:hypothetical protein
MQMIEGIGSLLFFLFVAYVLGRSFSKKRRQWPRKHQTPLQSPKKDEPLDERWQPPAMRRFCL